VQLIKTQKPIAKFSKSSQKFIFSFIVVGFLCVGILNTIQIAIANTSRVQMQHAHCLLRPWPGSPSIEASGSAVPSAHPSMAVGSWRQ
jgi:hypothetical protein